MAAPGIINYLATLPLSRQILWSYVAWWAVMVGRYFSPAPGLWISSLGIGLIVGYALMLCTGPVNLDRIRLRFWESMRMIICPVMVSSYSALTAGQGFILVFSPQWQDNAWAAAAVILFLVLCRTLRLAHTKI